MRSRVDAEYLRSVFDYNPDIGVFVWKRRDDIPKKVNANTEGKQAFTSVDGWGYLKTQINGMVYKAHRVAWCIHSGGWPEFDVDHIDGDRTNNRISNLRPATKRENQWNKGRMKNNKSGYRGVSLNKKSGMWCAFIRCDGKNKNIGSFPTPELASAAYERFAERLHGEFYKRDAN